MSCSCCLLTTLPGLCDHVVFCHVNLDLWGWSCEGSCWSSTLGARWEGKHPEIRRKQNRILIGPREMRYTYILYSCHFWKFRMIFQVELGCSIVCSWSHGVLLSSFDVWSWGDAKIPDLYKDISQRHRMHTGATFEFLGDTSDTMEAKIREAHHLVYHEAVWQMGSCPYPLVQDVF